MAAKNPLEAAVDGYAAIYNAGPDGFSVGGHSLRDPAALAELDGNPTVTNLERARWIARTFHNWDISSESELHTRRMLGEIYA